MGSVPVRKRNKWLGDHETGAFLGKFFSRSGDGVAKPESGKPNLRLPGRSKRCAGETGELLLCGAGGGAADLLTVDKEKFASIVLLEGKEIPVR